MERQINVNKLVNNLVAENAALKTYYTLLLMAENEVEKTAVDKRFWSTFQSLSPVEQTDLRRALQAAEKNLLTTTKELHQEVRDFKAELQGLKHAA